MPWHTEGPAAAAGYFTEVDVEETAAEGLEGEGGADGEGVVVKKKRNRRPWRVRSKRKKYRKEKDEGLEVDNLLQSEFEFFDGDLQGDEVNLNDVLGIIVSKKRKLDRLESLLREAKASIDEQSVIVRRAMGVKKAGELSEVEGGPGPARRVTPKPAEEESPKSGEEVTPGPAPAAEPTESAPEAVEDAGDDPKHGGEGDDEEDGDAVEEDEESDGPPPLLDAQEDEEEEEDEEQKSHPNLVMLDAVSGPLGRPYSLRL